jgi:hypothetical protein
MISGHCRRTTARQDARHDERADQRQGEAVRQKPGPGHTGDLRFSLSGSVAHFLGARVFRRMGNMPQCEQLIHSSWWIVEADLETMTVMTFSFAVRTFVR